MPKWTFGYDGAMQLVEAVAEDGSEDVIEHERYGYDKAGNRIQVVTGTTSSPAVRNYKVNNLNQLVSERGFGRTLFSGEVDEPATVTVNGQPAKVMSTEGVAPFRFEAWVQLPAGTSQVVIEAKDGNDNTTTETYEVTTTGTTALFSYDLEGNMTYEREPNEDPKWEYRWDQEARLVRAVWGDRETVFEYDGETRRVRIKELDDEVDTANHVYIWCGGRICQKREDDGETVVRNFFEEGFKEGANRYFYTTDHLGSIWQVVDDDAETITSLTTYSPWGVQSITGAGPHSSFGYTGHLRQSDPTALALPQYRGYDARLGRWLSRDPLGTVDGANVHRYVRNNPISYDDPDGRHPGVWILRLVKVGCKWVWKKIFKRGKGKPKPKNPPHPHPPHPDPEPGPPSPEREPHFPDRPLPRDPHGNPTPDPEAQGRRHTQMGRREGKHSGGEYDQAREFDADGKPVRDIDFTDHGRGHPNPHQHRYTPNPTGGTPSRGDPEPLE